MLASYFTDEPHPQIQILQRRALPSSQASHLCGHGRLSLAELMVGKCSVSTAGGFLSHASIWNLWLASDTLVFSVKTKKDLIYSGWMRWPVGEGDRGYFDTV